MLKILVPIDFSSASKNAVNYALPFARMEDSQIILYHCVEKISTDTLPEPVDLVLLKSAERKMQRFFIKVQSEFPKKLNLTTVVDSGYPLYESLQSFVKKNNVHLIVMGSTGAGRMKETLFGSNAVDAIQSVECPVLLVPEKARYNGIKHIAYATDLVKVGTEMKTAVNFSKILKARLHVIHFFPEAIGVNKINTDIIKKQLVTKYEYPHITFYAEMNNDPDSGINSYLKQHSIDVLLLFTKRMSLFDQLFGSSITTKLAFRSKTPLLVFKK